MFDDYPAAHSMDTHWFAVDQHGHVGLFFTAESSYMPAGISDVESGDLVELYRVLTGEAPPGVEDGEDDYIDDWDELLDALGERGFFYYNYIDSFGNPDELLLPYTLWGEPEGEPLHVDRLPTKWRERISKCRFDSVSFGEDEYLQPFDAWSGVWWVYDENACAYLAADEQTLRPVPKRKMKYRKFCKEQAEKLKEKGWRPEEAPPRPDEEAKP